MTKKSFTQLFSIMAITVCVIAASCKKEHTNSSSSSNSIIGKWTLEKQIVWTTSGSSTTKDTTDLTATNSYEDFRSDGKTYEKYFEVSTSNYFYDTATYTVTSNTLSTVDGHGISYSYDIQNQTANSMTLHSTVVNSAKFESWFFLAK